MDKKTLKQYRALLRELPKLNRDIGRLQERLDNVPIVSGKVTKSSDDFPYIEQHLTVQIQEPREAAEIRRQITIKEQRRDSADHDKTEIEEFIAGISDSTDRQIFELSYIDGKRQADVAKEVGYSQGRVSQIIGKYLKDKYY